MNATELYQQALSTTNLSGNQRLRFLPVIRNLISRNLDRLADSGHGSFNGIGKNQILEKVIHSNKYKKYLRLDQGLMMYLMTLEAPATAAPVTEGDAVNEIIAAYQDL